MSFGLGAFPLPLEEPSLIYTSEADEGSAIITAGSGQEVQSGSGREENVITIGEGSGAAETGSGGISGLSSGQGSGAEQETIDRGESGDLVGNGQEYGTGVPSGEGNLSGEGGNGVSGASGNIESGSGVIDLGNGVWLGGGVSRIETSTPEKPTDERELATWNIFQLLQALQEAYPYKTNK